MDPVTKDTFTNKSRLVCLKPTGDVLLEETYNKLVKPEGNFNGVRAYACSCFDYCGCLGAPMGLILSTVLLLPRPR